MTDTAVWSGKGVICRMTSGFDSSQRGPRFAFLSPTGFEIPDPIQQRGRRIVTSSTVEMPC